MSIIHGPNIVTNGLVFCVDATDKNSYIGSGTTWRDVSGKSNINLDASLVDFDINLFRAVSLGEYIWFGGTNAYLENLTDDGNSHTFECWWMPMGTPTGANDGYFCGRKGFHLGHRQLKANGLQHNCLIWFSDATSGTVGDTYTYPGYNTWAHLCYVVDESANTATYFVNGQQYGTSYDTTGKSLRDYGTGDYHLFAGFTTNWSANGGLSVVRFYNRALSAGEVLQNYNSSKSRFGL